RAYQLEESGARVARRVLGRLESRPAFPVEPERQTVESRDLDHQPPVRLEGAARCLERSGRGRVGLPEVPHRDQVEAIAPDFLLVEESAVELGAVKLWPVREVDEVDPGRPDAVPGAEMREKGAGAAADVEYLAAGGQGNVPADDSILETVV